MVFPRFAGTVAVPASHPRWGGFSPDPIAHPPPVTDRLPCSEPLADGPAVLGPGLCGPDLALPEKDLSKRVSRSRQAPLHVTKRLIAPPAAASI